MQNLFVGENNLKRGEIHNIYPRANMKLKKIPVFFTLVQRVLSYHLM